MLKLIAFFQKNKDFPFYVKRKILEAAFLPTLLYGCESWLTDNVSKVESVYMTAVKAHLGVRVTTCSDICLVELGLPPVAAIIKDKQKRFFQTMLRARSTMTDDPFMYCLNLTLNSRNKTARYMTSVLDYQGDVLTLALDRVRHNVLTSTSSKRQAYVLMNPSLSVHNVYKNMDLSVRVPEHQRLAFSRLRVISHNLRIETGRWARITRKNRLCPCGLMQTEQHIIENCNLLSNIRECYPGMTFNFDILLNTAEPDMFKVIYDMLNYFS